MEDRLQENYISDSLDIDVNAIPAVKTYHHQISLPCYGRGKRLCDIQVPNMPRSLLTVDDKTIAKPRSGRGRGKGRGGQEENNFSKSPRGLKDVNTLSDSCSVCSNQSSNDSERCKRSGGFSQQGMDLDKCDEPDLQNSSRHPVSFSSSSKQNHSVSSTPKKVDGASLPSLHDDAIPDSPPLINLEGWSVMPPGVCQLEGIPLNMDLNIVNELFSSYGTIADWEEKRIDGTISLRVKLNNAEICDLIQANIDKSDFSGMGSVVRCKHLSR